MKFTKWIEEREESFNTKSEADKVYHKSLDKPYWAEISKKYPNYNKPGPDTDKAVKWLLGQIANDFKGDYSDEQWTLMQVELASGIYAGLT